MTRSDLDRVIKILSKEQKYTAFIQRITKDFQQSQTKGIPVAMHAFFEKDKEEDAGFCIISLSPLKMKEWEKTFKQEGWVGEDFKIGLSSFELMYLYIKPFFRKKGFGGKLFDKVINYAKKSGIKAVYSYVSDTNQNALHFYKHKGADTIYTLSDEGGANSSAFLVWNVH